jgi:hypothetical protein
VGIFEPEEQGGVYETETQLEMPNDINKPHPAERIRIF